MFQTTTNHLAFVILSVTKILTQFSLHMVTTICQLDPLLTCTPSSLPTYMLIASFVKILIAKTILLETFSLSCKVALVLNWFAWKSSLLEEQTMCSFLHCKQ